MRKTLNLHLILFALGLMSAVHPAVASPADCPKFPFEVSPRDVVIYVPSTGYSLVRSGGRRMSTAEVIFKRGTDIYYVAASDLPNSEMAFALKRTMVISEPTTLDPALIYLSRSGSSGGAMPIEPFRRFHAAHSLEPNPARVLFHLKMSRLNTYELESPRVYLPAAAPRMSVEQDSSTVTVSLARMQTNKGVGPEGRCIRFSVFENSSFADATLAYTATIIAILDDDRNPVDTAVLNIRRRPDE